MRFMIEADFAFFLFLRPGFARYFASSWRCMWRSTRVESGCSLLGLVDGTFTAGDFAGDTEITALYKQ